MSKRPELILVAGCNAAGKSTFIRSRLDELGTFDVLMTDVYKGRTKELAAQAINVGRDVLIETVFNDESFKDLVDKARNAGYHSSLVVLFLDTLLQSNERVAMRGTQQSGIAISGNNVKINFNESFKNVASYFFYFDRSDFIYTGAAGLNRLIMTFHKSILVAYYANELDYPQKFASYSHNKQRLTEDGYRIITANQDFSISPEKSSDQSSKFKL